MLLLLSTLALAEPPSLVLVSLDTTRADALSCYGAPAGLTPNLDALAAEGVRLEHFYASAPTTLSSHTTMMTGLDPHEHGIPRNGAPLSDDLVTLAERLGAAGWDPLAVVASKALAATTHISQGFRVYDDDTPELMGIMYQDRADGVLARVRAVLAQRDPERPLFLFVHLYDPHAPYDPPEPFRSRWTDPAYDGPYQGSSFTLGELHQDLVRGRADPADVAQVEGLYRGEVAYVDHAVGELLELLAHEGVLDHAVVAVTADHGESLSDEPAYAFSHGSSVSHSVMHVPLILRGYGVPLAERAVVARQASMTGLAPTLERALGLEATLGRDLWDLVRPGPVRDVDGWPEGPTRVVVMEATRPRQRQSSDAWNNLPFDRAVRAGGWEAGATPHLDVPLALRDGPGGVQPADLPLTPVLGSLLEAWDADAPAYVPVHMPPETRAALKALGYLDGEGD